MGQYRVNIAAPNLTSICVDHVENGEYSGRIFHKYKSEGITFKESSQVISILEELFNQINYPQASTKYRSFQKEDRKKNETVRKREPVKPVQTAEEVLNHKGGKGTFILHVQYRQNSTWQGKVIWVEEELEEEFCSVLELLKLLDSALAEE